MNGTAADSIKKPADQSGRPGRAEPLQPDAEKVLNPKIGRAGSGRSETPLTLKTSGGVVPIDSIPKPGVAVPADLGVASTSVSAPMRPMCSRTSTRIPQRGVTNRLMPPPMMPTAPVELETRTTVVSVWSDADQQRVRAQAR